MNKYSDSNKKINKPPTKYKISMAAMRSHAIYTNRWIA